MAEIGCTGGPRLGAMGLHREDVRLVQGVFVSIGVVRLDPFDKLELPNHPALMSRLLSLATI